MRLQIITHTYTLIHTHNLSNNQLIHRGAIRMICKINLTCYRLLEIAIRSPYFAISN